MEAVSPGLQAVSCIVGGFFTDWATSISIVRCIWCVNKVACVTQDRVFYQRSLFQIRFCCQVSYKYNFWSLELLRFWSYILPVSSDEDTEAQVGEIMSTFITSWEVRLVYQWGRLAPESMLFLTIWLCPRSCLLLRVRHIWRIQIMSSLQPCSEDQLQCR